VIVTLPSCQCLKSPTLVIQIQVNVSRVGIISKSSLLNCFIFSVHVIFIGFQLGKEESRSRFGCNDTCSFKLGTVGSEMLRGMVMANTTEVGGQWIW